MKSMVVREARMPLVAEERGVPNPGRGEVRIRVHACGVCHSDHFVIDGLWPGLQLPRVPGHEIAGVIDAVGDEVTTFRVGDRVGVGWHGGHDGTCSACLKGKFIHCRNARITGVTADGGFSDFMISPAVAVASVPPGMPFADAAPLLCAGVTTFNALRNVGARSGDLVAVHGLGGLGHLGVQYARAMGFEVVSIARGADREKFARDLGAAHYVDSTKEDVGERLQARGGARVVLATAPSSEAIASLVAGLGIEGCLLIVAAPFEPIPVGAVDLISRDARIQGWSSGTATDSTDAMAFAHRSGVRPVIETFALGDAQLAYERMMSGRVRFRAVLEIAPGDDTR